MSNQLYRPPHSGTPSWMSSLNKRTNRTSKDISTDCIDITNNDEFPEMLTNTTQHISNDKISSSFLKTIDHTEINRDDKDTISQNTHDFSIEDGWVEITKDTYKHTKNSEQLKKIQTLKKTKDPFIKRLLCKDSYVHSLDDKQYAMIANKAMNKVVDIYQKQAADFISIYGEEYYDQNYGYVPVYGKRVVKGISSNSCENTDMGSLTGVYNEYYTDEDEIYNDEEHDYEEEFEEY